MTAHDPPRPPPRLRLWAMRCAGLALALALVPVLQVLTVRFVNPPLTLSMVEAVLDHHRFEGDWAWPRRTWRNLDALGHVPRAFVSAEDQAFWAHDGFDWDAVCGALASRGSGEPVRGASTVSQQVARNAFLWQRRSWLRKGLEVGYTLLLELFVPKERILELYVNLAETGPLTFGAEAGARLHFHEEAASLDEDEAFRLACIPPSPRKWTVSSEKVAARARLLTQNPAPWPGTRAYDAWRADAPGRQGTSCLIAPHTLRGGGG